MEHRPWRQLGDHQAGDDTADGDADADETGHAGAHPLGRQLGGDGDGVGNHPAHAEAGKESQDHQGVQVVGQQQAQAEQAVEHRADHDTGLAPDAVAEPAEGRGAEQDAEQARAQHRSEGRALQMPGLEQAGRCEAHHLYVVAFDDQGQQGQDQDPDRECPEPLAVDQRLDIDPAPRHRPLHRRRSMAAYDGQAIEGRRRFKRGRGLSRRA